MATGTGASRSTRRSRAHLHLTPDVITSRRGGHAFVARAERTEETPAPRPVPGVELISSARGVRLDGAKPTRRGVASRALDLHGLRI